MRDITTKITLMFRLKMHIILTKASLWRKFWYFKQYLAQTMPNVGLNWSFLFSKYFLLHGMTSVILWGFGSERKLTNSILIGLKLRLNALFPVCLIRFPSVPLVVLLSSVQISGGWYNGRHFCQSNQNNSKRLFVKKLALVSIFYGSFSWKLELK